MGGMELIALAPIRVGFFGSLRSKTFKLEGGCGKSFQMENNPSQMMGEIGKSARGTRGKGEQPRRMSGTKPVTPRTKGVKMGCFVAIGPRKRLATNTLVPSAARLSGRP